MFIGLYEDGAYRGYLGSFAGSSTDVDFGTGSGNSAGSLHLTIEADPALSIDPNSNVGIGTTSPGTNRLKINIADAVTPTGLFVQNDYTGASSKYGININVNEQGSGSKYGTYTLLEGTAADASAVYGNYLNAIPNGTGGAYGSYTYLSPIGTGARYGTYNWVDAAAASSSAIYGSHQWVTHNGTGTTYGYSADVNKAAGQAGTLYGLNITADNDGTGNSYLLYGNSVGATTGTEYGVYVTGEDVNYFSNNVGIGTSIPDRKLKVVSNTTLSGEGVIHGEFTGSNTNAAGLHGVNTADVDYGYGVLADGGSTGVFAAANIGGIGDRYGVIAYGQNGDDDNYGVYALANFGTNAYGIFARALYGTTNYAGYFSGNVFCTGAYQPSDRKLKTGIMPLSGALSIISRLNPSVYNYNNEAYRQMNLPEGLQYGLIADEVQQVIPNAVTKAVQPAEYENNDKHNGKKLSDKVEFNAINYTSMIPVLIAAVKEQQQLIEELKKQTENQQKEIDELKRR
jgi:hypothetical protein